MSAVSGSGGPSGRRAAAAAGARLTIDVVMGDPPWRTLGALDPQVVIAAVAGVLAAHAALPAAETTATVALSCDAEVRGLNKSWRGLDKATNVLSFPSAQAPQGAAGAADARFLGDIILAEETLAREAEEMGIAVADHFRHLVLHGLLHLLGHDHEQEGEAAEMEGLETRILASLGVADPYAGSEVVVKDPSLAPLPAQGTPKR